MDDKLKANQANWDERVPLHAESPFYDVEGFKAGRMTLDSLETGELGDVTGKTLLHLQCHFGLGTLSWTRLGAIATGMDFSAKGIALARKLAEELNLPARFICSDLYDLPNKLDERFDIVFTSYGVLTWLPDLKGWARVVARFLKPGGTFFIAEIHPFAMTLLDEEITELRFHYPYFQKGSMRFDDLGSYATERTDTRNNTTYEWMYPLGEVVTALIEAGLRIETLREFSQSCYQMLPFMVKGEDGFWYLPENKDALPFTFTIKATLPE